MTLRINKEAGKGSNRRATQDDNTYRNNYDIIFSKKQNSIPALPETVNEGIEQYQKEQDDTKEN